MIVGLLRLLRLIIGLLRCRIRRPVVKAYMQESKGNRRVGMKRLLSAETKCVGADADI